MRDMRAYGRFMKNTAALLLLLALLSLLLPFCRFQAKGQDMTLSGVEVLTAGGKAGYTYLQQGGVPDDFVLKAPFTWGDVREGIHYADQTGNSNLLVVAGVAVCLPVILCFLAMCMLFLAEGKKTMVLPTIFIAAVTAELLVVLADFTAIHPFLLAGVYLFALFHIMALILILFGWTLGGYREPKQKKRGKDGADREKNEDRDRKKSRDHSRSRHKKSKGKKKRRSSKDSKKKDDKKDKSNEKSRKKNEDQDEKNSQDQKYNGIIKLQIHPVIPSRTGQLNHSIFLVYLKAIAKNAQIFFKFFPVFQHKIIICFGILVSFAQKAGSQKTVANPAEIILFFLQHSFQIFHFLSSVSENL